MVAWLGRQLLGAQRHRSRACIRAGCRPAPTEGPKALRRTHPQPRFRGSGADASGRMGDSDGAGARRQLRGMPAVAAGFCSTRRRWCQGNLQHLAVLPARGLHWVSRLHLLTGIGSYITAPLWLLFLVLGILISLQAQFVRPEYFPKGFSLFPKWPAQDPVLAAWVFAGTMGLLIAPKLLACILVGTQTGIRRQFGGGIRMLASVLVETFLSGLIAPVMMIFQSTAVGRHSARSGCGLAGAAPRRRRIAALRVDATIYPADAVRDCDGRHRLCGIAAVAVLDGAGHRRASCCAFRSRCCHQRDHPNQIVAAPRSRRLRPTFCFVRTNWRTPPVRLVASAP